MTYNIFPHIKHVHSLVQANGDWRAFAGNIGPGNFHGCITAAHRGEVKVQIPSIMYNSSVSLHRDIHLFLLCYM